MESAGRRRNGMGFWLIVLGSVLVAAVACGVYLVSRILKFRPVAGIKEYSSTRGILVAAGCLLVVILVLVVTMGMMNTMICVIHLAIFWAVCDLAALLFKANAPGRPYYAGICAIAVTVIYLAIAFVMAHSITPKEYSLTTDKDIEGLRIVQFADAHIGTTFGADGFARAVEQIRAYNPDVVVITGDLVDSSTDGEDFVKCCESLGSLKPKYGIYYVFGNHDRSFSSNMLSGKGGQSVISELEKNGVRVLQDESVMIGDVAYIIGRQDFSTGDRANGRKSMSELVGSLDESKYMIVLDHQPRDYDAQVSAGVDLVLSGHTHGGQMIPLHRLVGALGDNNLVYGHEKRGATDFIVTSGISDWEIKFKSGCRSEFVVIDVTR